MRSVRIVILSLCFPLGAAHADYATGATQAAMLATMASGSGSSGAGMAGMMMMAQQSAMQNSAKKNKENAESAKKEDSGPPPAKVPFPATMQVPAQILPEAPKETSVMSSSPGSGSSSGGGSALSGVEQYANQILETERKIRQTERRMVDDQVVAFTVESAQQVNQFIQAAKDRVTAFQSAPAQDRGIDVTRKAFQGQRGETADTGTVGDRLGTGGSIGRTGISSDPIGFSLAGDARPSTVANAVAAGPQDKLVTSGLGRNRETSGARDPGALLKTDRSK